MKKILLSILFYFCFSGFCVASQCGYSFLFLAPDRAGNLGHIAFGIADLNLNTVIYGSNDGVRDNLLKMKFWHKESNSVIEMIEDFKNQGYSRLAFQAVETCDIQKYKDKIEQFNKASQENLTYSLWLLNCADRARELLGAYGTNTPDLFFNFIPNNWFEDLKNRKFSLVEMRQYWENMPESASDVTHTLSLSVIDSRSGWQKTGIYVRQNMILEFKANGQWSNGLYQNIQGQVFRPQYGPDGEPQLESGFRYLYNSPDTRVGALVGRIGNSVFHVGQSNKITAPAEGYLYLGMNDDPNTTSDNAGKVFVEVIRRIIIAEY